MPGESGFLARTPAEWLEAVKSLAAEPVLRRRMGMAGRAAVEANYSVDRWAARFVSAILGDG